MENMHSNLRYFRLTNNLTQKEMADILGYKDKSGYWQLENGNVKLSLEHIEMLASHFNESVDELIKILR